MRRVIGMDIHRTFAEVMTGDGSLRVRTTSAFQRGIWHVTLIASFGACVCWHAASNVPRRGWRRFNTLRGIKIATSKRSI
jgi:hypothetical protein